jgi:hypothetical protein
MKIIKIISFIICIIFSNCSRVVNNLQDQINNNQTDYKNIDNVDMQNINNDTSNIQRIITPFSNQRMPDTPIKNSRDYILNDFGNIKTRKYNSEDILFVLNISENYIVSEYTQENTTQVGSGNLYFYNIEWDQFKISYLSSDYIDYYLFQYLEIKLTENNYLHLFPYIHIEEYVMDEDFGEKNIFGIPIERQLQEDILRYNIYDDIEDENPKDRIFLIFNNGLLNSIRISSFNP